MITAGMEPSDWIGELAKQGPGWMVAAILAFVVWYLWKEQRAAATACETERAATNKAHEDERAAWMQARLNDWKEIATLVKEQNVVQSQLTAARETGAAATNAMADAARQQTAVITRLIEAVDRGIASNAELRDTILTKGMGKS